MDLEFHQLDLRYEALRIRDPRRERRLLASIGEAGQRVPIAVVIGDDRKNIVVDGFARVRVLRQLGRDTVRALEWDLTELEALLLARSLRLPQSESMLEQGWLLAELADRFDLEQEELARRFDRSQSWVSRRLALVSELPQGVQDEVREGRIVPHAAAKYLVPMARADRQGCERMARAISKLDLSTRDIGRLYVGWRDGSPEVRERVIDNPELFLRVRRSVEKDGAGSTDRQPRDLLLKEMGVIGAAVRRAREEFQRSAAELVSEDRRDVSSALRVARSEVERLWQQVRQHPEERHARPRHSDDDPRAA